MSVIIAVFNGTATLGAQLDALARQVNPPVFEVLVMDNNSTDDLTSLLSEDRGLDLRTISATERQGQCYARNLGVREARGKHVLICDQDDVVSPGWVRALHDALQNDRVLATGVMDVARLNRPAIWRVYTEGGPPMLRPYPVQGYLPFAYGCNLAVRRDDYLALRGMDNSYRGGDEDTDFSWRAQEAGFRLVCVDDAVVHYRLRATPKELLRQRRGYGRTRVLTWVRSLDDSRPLSGMSLAWTVKQAALLPLVWLRSRRTEEERFRWALRAGAVLGNLEGQVRYRMRRRTPAPDFFPL